MENPRNKRTTEAQRTQRPETQRKPKNEWEEARRALPTLFVFSVFLVSLFSVPLWFVSLLKQRLRLAWARRAGQAGRAGAAGRRGPGRGRPSGGCGCSPGRGRP